MLEIIVVDHKVIAFVLAAMAVVSLAIVRYDVGVRRGRPLVTGGRKS
jgi:hypothetical protein